MNSLALFDFIQITINSVWQRRNTPNRWLMCFAMAYFSLINIPNSAAEDALPSTTIVIAREPVLSEDHEDVYYTKLLDLVLTKTIPSYGPFTIKTVPVITVDQRLFREIQQDHIQVTWKHYQDEFNTSLRPIKIRLLKKLSDYRLFLIRKGDQARFDEVKSINDLRKMRGGIGAQWPDRLVMEANNLPLEVSVNYANLFKMLSAGRFDYFSRGIYQILPEARDYATSGLVVEEHLMLYYDNPVYFYVNKTNGTLANRLEQGLTMAIEDGSFDALFAKFPRYVWAQEQLNDNKRLVININNR